jgi:hypothetical protein
LKMRIYLVGLDIGAKPKSIYHGDRWVGD